MDTSRADCVNAAQPKTPAGVNGLILRTAFRVYKCKREEAKRLAATTSSAYTVLY